MRAYQADIAKFEQAGTQVIGIDVDSQAKNRAFAQQLAIKFPILSDEQKTVSKQYQVLIPFIRLARRTTFVVDKEGIIRNIQKGGEAVDPNNALQVCSVKR